MKAHWLLQASWHRHGDRRSHSFSHVAGWAGLRLPQVSGWDEHRNAAPQADGTQAQVPRHLSAALRSWSAAPTSRGICTPPRARHRESHVSLTDSVRRYLLRAEQMEPLQRNRQGCGGSGCLWEDEEDGEETVRGQWLAVLTVTSQRLLCVPQHLLIKYVSRTHQAAVTHETKWEIF